MAAKKHEDSFVTERTCTPCAGHPECRFPGRLWVRTLAHDQRLCVNHYYRAIEADSSLAFDEPVPPRSERMLGVVPKPVAGAD